MSLGLPSGEVFVLRDDWVSVCRTDGFSARLALSIMREYDVRSVKYVNGLFEYVYRYAGDLHAAELVSRQPAKAVV